MRRRIESLSPRQLEVMTLVAQHFSSKEIARLLGGTAATIDNHVSAALKRLRVMTRREGAALMIELGYATGLPDPETRRAATQIHHGGDRYTSRRTLSFGGIANIYRVLNRSRKDPEEKDGRFSAYSRNSGMVRAGIRFFIDAIYITLFFVVMSAASYGAHLVVVECERRNIDHVVLVILKTVSYLLVSLDAIGVVIATGLLTFRFIRAIARTND